jgi:hypothetical protein
MADRQSASRLLAPRPEPFHPSGSCRRREGKRVGKRPTGRWQLARVESTQSSQRKNNETGKAFLDAALLSVISLIFYSFSNSAISAVTFPEDFVKLVPLGAKL